MKIALAFLLCLASGIAFADTLDVHRPFRGDVFTGTVTAFTNDPDIGGVSIQIENDAPYPWIDQIRRADFDVEWKPWVQELCSAHSCMPRTLMCELMPESTPEAVVLDCLDVDC